MGDVFQLLELSLSSTPGHGSMLAFQASEVVHGTRIPDVLGKGCQRIGSAIAMALQRRAIIVAVAQHEEGKTEWMQLLLKIERGIHGGTTSRVHL